MDKAGKYQCLSVKLSRRMSLEGRQTLGKLDLIHYGGRKSFSINKLIPPDSDQKA